ncbi:MAG: caspase family protein [Pseudomonadota bacterium]
MTCFSVAPAGAEARRALLIGIDNYSNVPALQKAVGDVQAMKPVLERLGFTVDLVINPDRRTLNLGVSSFAAKLRPGDTALVHFSGHGIAVDGENFLLPADVPKPASGDKELVKSEGMPMTGLLDRIRGAGPRVTVLILDACRDNPFAQGGTRAIGVSGGLGQVQLARGAAQSGVFIMYSAGYGQTARDRLDDNDREPTSLYTRTLLRKISVAGKPITDLAREVREDVEALAITVRHEQRPAYYDELSGPAFYFAPSGTIAAPPQPARPPADNSALARPTPPPSPQPVAAQPSFDCRYARLPDELAVCASPQLAALDRRLSQLYYARVDGLDGDARLALRRQQGDWLGQRKLCGSNAACVSQAYSSRIAVLQGQGGPAPAPPPAVAATPSFNCAKARTADEIAICNDGVLAAKDRQLSALYSGVLTSLSLEGQQRLAAAQKAWLAQRGQCGASVACIASAYDSRIRQLGAR